MRTYELGGARVVVRRLTHGAKLERFRLNRRFVGELSDNITPDERDLYNAKANLCFVSVQTTEHEGLGFELPNSDMTQEQFDVAFAGYLELDDDFVDGWVDTVVDIQKEFGESHTLPAGSLKKEQLRDPNLESAAPSSSKKKKG